MEDSSVFTQTEGKPSRELSVCESLEHGRPRTIASRRKIFHLINMISHGQPVVARHINTARLVHTNNGSLLCMNFALLTGDTGLLVVLNWLELVGPGLLQQRTHLPVADTPVFLLALLGAVADEVAA